MQMWNRSLAKISTTMSRLDLVVIVVPKNPPSAKNRHTCFAMSHERQTCTCEKLLFVEFRIMKNGENCGSRLISRAERIKSKMKSFTAGILEWCFAYLTHGLERSLFSLRLLDTSCILFLSDTSD